jgi:molybdate transport system substrate-binding protein
VAASLRDTFADLARAYEAVNPGVRLLVTADASNALRAQIETGAVADVFVSADTTNPQRLVDMGSTVGPARVFAANELALVTPAADAAGIQDAYGLARPGVRVVAAGPDVPISGYVRRLIGNLEAQPGAPAGLGQAIEANTVSREDNVRVVLAKIELGEGDAAFVYATDARGDPNVRVVPLPPGVNVRTACAAVVPDSAAHPAEGSALVEGLTGPEAGAILRGRGFLPP